MPGARGHGTGVAELHAGRGAGLVHGLGEPRQAGNGLVPHEDLARRALPVFGHRAVRERRHADTAGRDRPVVVDQPVGHDVLAGHPLERRGLDDAVPQGDRSELRG